MQPVEQRRLWVAERQAPEAPQLRLLTGPASHTLCRSGLRAEVPLRKKHKRCRRVSTQWAWLQEVQRNWRRTCFPVSHRRRRTDTSLGVRGHRPPTRHRRHGRSVLSQRSRIDTSDISFLFLSDSLQTSWLDSCTASRLSPLRPPLPIAAWRCFLRSWRCRRAQSPVQPARRKQQSTQMRLSA